MVKTDTAKINESFEVAPSSAWFIAALAWFVPGAGHLALRKWSRAALMGGSVWTCFITGLAMGGHLFDIWSNSGSSPLLQVPPMIANLGSGLLYLICWFVGIGLADDPQQAARATYEYGTTFLLIAGLLNYLIMLDAFDIAARRKP